MEIGHARGDISPRQRGAKHKMLFSGHVMHANGLEKEMMLACGEGREVVQERDGWRKYTRCQRWTWWSWGMRRRIEAYGEEWPWCSLEFNESMAHGDKVNPKKSTEVFVPATKSKTDDQVCWLMCLEQSSTTYLGNQKPSCFLKINQTI